MILSMQLESSLIDLSKRSDFDRPSLSLWSLAATYCQFETPRRSRFIALVMLQIIVHLEHDLCDIREQDLDVPRCEQKRPLAVPDALVELACRQVRRDKSEPGGAMVSAAISACTSQRLRTPPVPLL